MICVGQNRSNTAKINKEWGREPPGIIQMGITKVNFLPMKLRYYCWFMDLWNNDKIMSNIHFAYQYNALMIINDLKEEEQMYLSLFKSNEIDPKMIELLILDLYM